MAKGENIFHRKDGRWEARYIKGYELSGKIKYGFCYGKTYREAKEKVTKYKAALVNGKTVPTNTAKHRFAYYCNEWLRLKKGKIRESTYIKYSTALEKHIKSKLGGCFPLGISTGVIDDFTHELLFDDGYSSARQYHRTTFRGSQRSYGHNRRRVPCEMQLWRQSLPRHP